MADRVQSTHIPSVSARPAMEADECSESESSTGAEQADAQTPPEYYAEPEKQFILKYKALPQLWNTSDIRYSNRFERYRALEQLLPIYQKMKPYATMEDIKKKINSLRSNYRRELKKYVASTKSGINLYYPKVWYFPHLSFLKRSEDLDDQIECKPVDAINMTDSQQNTKQERPPFIPKAKSISGCSEARQRAPVPPLKMKRKMVREKIRNVHYPSQQLQHRHQCQKISNPLALEWSETLERLDPLQRLYAKKAINDVLFEAELGCLHKHSVRINESNSYYERTSPSRMSASDARDPPACSSVEQSDPISTKNNDSASDVDYKIPIAFLQCNLENDGQGREPEFGD